MPPDLARVASRFIGEIEMVADHSWARPDSAVWQVTGASGGSWFVKRHHSAVFHGREVTAYQRWTGSLGAGRAPGLTGADRATLAIVVTALPGKPVRDLMLSADDEREVHRQAGILLRRFHQAGPSTEDTGSTLRAIARVDEHLRRASGILTPAQVSIIRRAAAQLQQAAAGFRAVPVHGDAQPRNWIWDPGSRRLALIDFERAETGLAVRDLVRLEYGPWDRRPDLRHAFLSGYGRELSAGELGILRCLAALDALSGIQWGMASNDEEVTRRGWRTLERLSASA